MAIYLIVLIGALNHAGFGGSRVLVSLYALHLGASQFALGMIMGLYSFCPMLLSITIGKLVDRIGPRLPMLLGTIGLGVGLLLPPLFPQIATLYFLTLLIGTAFNFIFVTVTGIAGGIGGSENRVRNYALMSLGFSGASFLGPMVAGFSIDHLGHLPTFVLLASFTLVPMLLLFFKGNILPHAAAHDGTGGRRKVIDLWRVRVLRNTFIASGFISAAWELFQFYMPVYGYSLGLSASVIGMVIAAFAAATFVIRSVLPNLVKRFSEITILTYAIFVAASAFVLFPFFGSAPALASIAFLLGLGLGCGQPISMSLLYACSPSGRIAESAGLRVTVNTAIQMVIPVIFGSVGTVFGFFPVFISNAVMLITGGFLFRGTRVQDSGE